MEKIHFEKIEVKNHIVDKDDGKVLQEGTVIDAKLLNRYEETLAKLVEAHNRRVDEMQK